MVSLWFEEMVLSAINIRVLLFSATLTVLVYILERGSVLQVNYVEGFYKSRTYLELTHSTVCI